MLDAPQSQTSLVAGPAAPDAAKNSNVSLEKYFPAILQKNDPRLIQDILTCLGSSQINDQFIECVGKELGKEFQSLLVYTCLFEKTSIRSELYNKFCNALQSKLEMAAAKKYEGPGDQTILMQSVQFTIHLLEQQNVDRKKYEAHHLETNQMWLDYADSILRQQGEKSASELAAPQSAPLHLVRNNRQEQLQPRVGAVTTTTTTTTTTNVASVEKQPEIAEISECDIDLPPPVILMGSKRFERFSGTGAQVQEIAKNHFLDNVRAHSDVDQPLRMARQSAEHGVKASSYFDAATAMGQHAENFSSSIQTYYFKRAHEETIIGLAQNKNDTDALYVMASLCLDGNKLLPFPKSVENATYYLTKLESSSPWAKYQLAKIKLDNPQRSEKDHKEIIRLLEGACAVAYSPAYLLLGNLYHSGDAKLGIAINKGLAASNLLAAAKCGHIETTFNLLTQNYHDYVIKAADSNLLHQLGEFILSMNMLETDAWYATDYLATAADKGNLKSAYLYANTLLTHPDIPKDTALGKIILERLKKAHVDIPEARRLLGKLCLEGHREFGISQNLAMAAEYLLPLDNGKDRNAQYLLGKVYLAQCEKLYGKDMSTLRTSSELQSNKVLKGFFKDACKLFGGLVASPPKSAAPDDEYYLANYELAMLRPVADPAHKEKLDKAGSHGYPLALYQLGVYHQLRKEFAEASKYFRRVYEDNNVPDNIRAKAAFYVGYEEYGYISSFAFSAKDRAQNEIHRARAEKCFNLAVAYDVRGAAEALKKVSK